MPRFQEVAGGQIRLAVCISLLILTCVLIAMVQAGGDPPEPGNKCCNPAHASTPTPPSGGDDDCYCHDTGEDEPLFCADGGGSECSGEQWENGVKGVCQDKMESQCNENAAQTLVTIRKGTAYCTSSDTQCNLEPEICKCLFQLNDPEEANQIQVDNCTGDGC